MKCVVCSHYKKYKCSKCREPYCSASCYQVHKSSCSGRAPSPKISSQPKVVEGESIVKTDYLSDEQLRVPLQKLERLRSDSQLLQILKSHALRNKLMAIDNSKQRMTNVQEAMQDQQFENFFKHTMEILQMGENPHKM